MEWTQIYYFFDGNFSNAHKIYSFPKSVSYKKEVCLYLASELKNGFSCSNPFISGITY